MTVTDWDDAYANAAHIPGAERYLWQWKNLAQQFRNRAVSLQTDIAYGPHPREKYDLFQPKADPAGVPVGVFIFVHGGYWMQLDKSSWSHLAAGALARGWAVAIPSYVLAPEARIADITGQIAAAISHVHQNFGGPLRLAGHSAGGHLVSRMLCENSPLSANVRDQIEHVVSISGLHDLRPLLNTRMNQTLGLSKAEATAESPALNTPLTNARLTAWVGQNERPEFIRQAQLIQESWADRAAHTACILEPGQHHFSVIDGLAQAGSDLSNCLFADP